MVFHNLLLLLSLTLSSDSTPEFTNFDPTKPLILSPYLKAGLIQEAQKVSTTEIGNTTSHTGYFTVNKECGSNLFFWFFKAEINWKEAPVLLWLNGGPGSSSLIGLFYEIGPWNHEKAGFVKNDYTWIKDHNVVFFDQPVGTGFSFTEKGCFAENMTVVRHDMYSALIQFFTMFPELQKNRFFLTGESYAGHYIPAIAMEIDIQNKDAKLKINLIGLIIGNPEIDLRCIYVGEYLYQLGIIDSRARDEIKGNFTEYNKAIDEKNFSKATELDSFALGIPFMNNAALPSVYNILYDTQESFDFKYYIRSYSIRKQIHVGDTGFTISNGNISGKLWLYTYRSEARTHIEQLLKTNKYIVGFYAGVLDVRCPYTSLVCVLKQLQWEGLEQYKNANRSQWYVSGKLAGWFKVAGNLFEVAIRKSGHMVPKDQGEAGLNLITAFVADNPGTKLLTRLKTQP